MTPPKAEDVFADCNRKRSWPTRPPRTEVPDGLFFLPSLFTLKEDRMDERKEDPTEPLPVRERGWTVKSINGEWDPSGRAYRDTLVFTKKPKRSNEGS